MATSFVFANTAANSTALLTVGDNLKKNELIALNSNTSLSYDAPDLQAAAGGHGHGHWEKHGKKGKKGKKGHHHHGKYGGGHKHHGKWKLKTFGIGTPII